MSATFEDKLREKIERLKNPQKGGGPRNTWKPKADTSTNVRLVRYPHQGAEEPYVELWFHYGLGTPFLCPNKLKGEDCAACSLSQSLMKKYTKEDYKLAKSVGPVQRFYAVVVDRTDPSMTPKFWGFGEDTYLELLEKLLDADFKTYLDPMTGYDLTVTSKKIKDRKYPKVTTQFRPNKCRLADSEKKIKDIINAIPKIQNEFEMLANDDIKKRLTDNWMNNSNGGDAPQQTAVDGGGTQQQETVGQYFGNQSDLNVDSAFEKALDE